MADLNNLLANAAGTAPTPADLAYQQSAQQSDASLGRGISAIGSGLNSLSSALGNALNSHIVTPTTAAPAANPNSLDAVSARVTASLAPLAPSKQASVAEKMTGLTGESYYPIAVTDSRNSDAGLTSAIQAEKDLRSMDQISFLLKYGNEGQKMLDRYNSARRDVDQQDINQRDWSEAGKDSVNSAATAAVTGLTSIAGWGAGAISPRVGAAIAKDTADFTSDMQGIKSQKAQDMAAQNAAISPLQDRDNEKQYHDDIKNGSSDMVASMRKLGRNFLAGAANEFSNPTTLAEGSANAIGSLLLSAPIGGAISKVAAPITKAILPETTRLGIALSADTSRALGQRSVSRLLDAAIEKGETHLPIAASVALQEGGGAYQQTAADVMGMDLDTLAAQSPTFQKLVAGGMSPEDARIQLANQAGQEAAPKQAAVGALTGAVVAPFEAHPFQVGTGRAFFQNMGKEALEEGTQNASGQVFQNQAERDTGVDPAKDLLDSVGRQAAQGAIYGAAAAGATAAPGAALSTTARAALGAGALTAKGVKALADRAPDALNAVADNTPRNLQDVKDTLGSIYSAASNVGSKAADVAGKAGNFAADLSWALAPKTSEKVADAYDATKAAAQKGIAAVTSKFPDVKDAAGNVADKVTSAVAGAKEKATTPTNVDFGGVVRNAATLARTGLSSIKPYISRVSDYFANRGDAVMKVNERNSPVSDETMANASQELAQQNAQLDALKQEIDESNVSDDVKSRANDYAQRAARITTVQPEQSAAWHPAVQAVVGNTTDRYAAIQQMQQFVADTKHSDADRLAVAAQLQAEKEDLQGMADANPRQLDGLPADHGLRSYAQGAAAFVQGINQTPGMSRADRASLPLIQKAAQLIAPLTKERVNTPEGQADAKTIANLAEVAPSELPEGSIKTALKHASKLGLNQNQKRSLKSADGLLQAAKDHFARLVANGDKPLSPKDLVTKQVTAGESNHPFKKSATQHAQGIAQSYRAGDLDTARLQLLDLQKFAHSQQNKLAAINQALVSGNADKSHAVHYEALSGNADRSFYTSEEGVWVDPVHFGSVRLARRVASEAKFLTDLSNHLATAYPELGVEHLANTSLDPRLADGTVSDVVRDFKAGTRSVKSEPVETKSQETKQPVTEPDTKDAVKDSSTPVESVNVADSVAEKLAASSASLDEKDSLVPTAEKIAEAAKTESVNEQPKQTPETKEPSKEGTKDKEASPAPEPTPAPKQGVEAAFPLLVQPGTEGNAFTKNFRLVAADKAGTPPSNILLHELPLAGIGDGVKQQIRVMSSSAAKGVFESYKSVFNGANEVAKIMRRNLQHFLTENEDRKSGKPRVPVGERFRNGTDAHRWQAGKVLNLTEDTGTTFKYNEQLLQGSVLAGMTWWLTSGQQGGVYDEKGAAENLGVQESVVGDDIMNRVKGTTSTLDALDSLVAKITQYWGVRANDDAQEGLAQGIPLSMAGEVLRALTDAGYLDVDNFYVHPSETDTIFDEPTADQIKEMGLKHIQRLVTIKTDNERNSEDKRNVLDGKMLENLRKFPDLIERAVMNDPTPAYYFDKARPKVADTQMRNEYVKNTQDQLSAIKNEQNTPNYLNETMANLYFDMGRDVARRWFGAGDLEGRALNVNHEASLVGQNRSIEQAFDEFENLHAALTGEAETKGIAITDVPTHYGYNMSRVGRMQMLGKFNPQSTKFIREIMLPTRSTLDLSQADQRRAFDLGLAQALGIKVHNETYDVVQSKLQTLLSKTFAPAVEHLQQWLTGNADFDTMPIENAFGAAGMAISPLALHALTEWARHENASADERKAFTTTKYLEADGMTNGPVNAMALLSVGPFDAQWVTNMRRGGLTIGGDETNTSQFIRNQPDNADLYKIATERLKSHITDLKSYFSNRKMADLQNQMESMQELMNLFLPDLDYDGKTLSIGRGVAKNPLTITIYGSGERGIAGKIARTMTGEIYERMSAAAQLMSDAERAKREITPAQAFFPNDPFAQDKWNRFKQNMDALTNFVAKSYEGDYTFEEAPTKNNPTGGDPVAYTLATDELKNLTTNIQHLFVKPLTKAIGDTVGNTDKGATMVRMATQSQSILLGRIFLNRVDAALEARAAKDPSFKKSDFLSAKEVRAVLTSMEAYHPLLKSDDQTFFVAGNQSSYVNSAPFGMALDDSFRSPGFVYGPANAGVAGIPFLNIGVGDGKMMQILANDPRIARTLKIFDGMNMPLDSIMEQSRAANEAVLESWRGNPLQMVLDSFRPFMNQIEKDGAASLKMTEAEELALAKSIFGLSTKSGDHTLQESLDAMKELVTYVERGAMQVEARHRVLDKLNLAVDQMSSAGAPHVVSGKIQLTGSDEEVAEQMAKMYADELAKIKVERGLVKDATVQRTPEETAAHTAAVESEDIAGQINQYGRINKQTGARVLSPSAIKKLTKGLENIPAHQKALLNDIRLSLSTKGYSVITGTAEQLAAYARNQGDEQSAQLSRGDSGVTLPDSRRIYIVNPDSEVLTHELIHAATFESVLAHYQGDTTRPEVADAIGRIETMLDQFRGLDVTSEAIGTQQSYADAMAAINQASGQDAVSKARALNEFMAWTLANKNLADLAGRTQVSTLVQLAKAAFDAIKSLIWGRKKVADPKPSNDLFSNLMFNSSIVMRSQPTPQQALSATALYHSSSYGTNDRLTDYNQTFSRMLDAFRTQPDRKDQPTTYKAQVNFAAVQAAGLAVALRGQGFLKTAQEASTFELIAAAMGTQMHLDANSMALAQELYQHVVKELEVEHFMADPESDVDPNDRYQAQAKYNAIIGDFGTTNDKSGRSSLLPVFIGLSIVDDQFRDILNTIGLPKAMQSTANSKLDATLENFFGGLMQKLADRTAGLGNEPTVGAAIDGLMQHVMKVAADREAHQSITGAETFLDNLDKRVVDAVSALSDKGVDAMQKVIDDPKSSPMARNAAKYAQLSFKMATEKGGNQVAESVVELMNRANAWQPIHDLVYDFVGRTEQNAPVYDMMKIVRSQVSQDRQNYREHVPSVIASKFSRELEDHEWTVLHRALTKTDIAALRQSLSNEEINEILGDAKQHSAAIDALEKQLQDADPKWFAARQKKAQQLARYMMTNEVGNNLLRNAHAVAHLWNETTRPKGASEHIVNLVDQLTSLYALEHLSPTERNTLLSLAQQEAEGIGYSTDYLVGQRAEEQRKMNTYNGRARANAFKGYVPESTDSGVHLMVAEDNRYQELTEKSYERLGDYQGSTADGTKGRMGYYFSGTSAKNVFLQGIFQNVRHTAGGVDVMTGYNNSTMNAGRITDRDQVARIALNLRFEKGNEPLMPIFDRNGSVVGFERSIDPQMLAKIQTPQNMAKQIGAWRGRQVEEEKAQRFNNALIDALHDRYESDMKKRSSADLEYVNLFDAGYLKANPVIADAVKLWTPETRAAIKARFGEDAFHVPKDMLHDVTGYRQPSVGDMWTGNSRWSKETQDYVKRTLIGMFGNKAYEYFTNGEKFLQNFIGDAKTLIVVKSVVVPMVNAMGNVLQLMSRGVPIKHVLTGIPKKIAETNTYVKQRQKQIEIEADLRTATDDVVKTRQLQTQWQVIEDGFKRLSIYPLIQNGEFTAISDATQVGADDVELTSGKWHSFLEAQVAKMPKAFQTAGRYAFVTKDTALYKGLQKSVEYGDFIAKAVLYDDLMNRHKLTQEKALGRITEEFVNYDKLPGRFRGYLESVGLLWFYNFKIRATKTAMSMLRNNPVHSLLAYSLPLPDLFSSVGTPLTDNFIAKLFSGQIGYSWGLGQLLHAPAMNPWVNMF
ncbi:hypothetical protein [Caballeronia sp. TF1N1]|uniref:hypothetical protein n=1 Tax=Caballeronia sp. TF1N1 TaxID=2878153 RepID=UPI001FD5C65A|nr:hypothetical protein [Caballeronia sp. TF1N1]